MNKILFKDPSSQEEEIEELGKIDFVKKLKLTEEEPQEVMEMQFVKDLNKQEEDEEVVEMDFCKDFWNTEDDENLIKEEIEKEEKKTVRKTYAESFKKEVISYYLRHTFAMTLVKYSIPFGTLKNWLFRYNSQGDEFFLDMRKFNGTKSIEDGDKALLAYINQLRTYHLPVTPDMVKKKLCY